MPDSLASRGRDRRRTERLALALLGSLAMALALPLARRADAAMDPAATAVIREVAARLKTGDEVQVAGAKLASHDVLPKVYERRSYELLWGDAASVRQLMAAVSSAYDEGLDPEDYHYATLRALVGDAGETLPTEPAARAGADLVLTDALIRLGLHLRFGKVDPASVDRAWDFLKADRAAAAGDAAEWTTAAVERGEIAELVVQSRPAIEGYDSLQHELARLREIERAGGWPIVPGGPTLRPGERDPRVLALRSRLVGSVEHDPLGSAENPGSGQTAPDGALYDEPLMISVREFQRTHGLEPDGVTGPQTLEALDEPPRHWIDQIRVNLERARWVRSGFANALVVDIAGFDARYVRNGELLWQARVQVGNPYRSTPVLSSRIRSVVLNPTWTVPPTILEEDILPQAQRDPLYIGHRGLQVIDRAGQTVDPMTIDWGSFTAGTLPYTLRQGPGAGNPLGRIKFLFPNPHFVYLHDTPSRSLFARADRAASSGCIRIERPLELAELLLAGNHGWTRERIDAEIASGRTRTIFLDDPVPIYLLYWTVGATPDGKVLFKKDVYERDAAVLAALDGDVLLDEGRLLSRQTP